MKNSVLYFIICFFLFAACKDQNKAFYEGKDMSNQVSIVRDKVSKAAYVNIETNGKWKLYAGLSVETIDFSRPIAEGEGSGTYSLPVDGNKRYYFQLVADEGKIILSDKHLPMYGGYNFRDLGGIRTSDGRYVKWGKIFRSDDLHQLTPGDLDYLSSIPLVSIVDFRSEKEMQIAPDKNPISVKKNYPFSITPGNLTSTESVSGFSIAQMDSVMMNMNELLVTDSVCIARYKDFFELLQNEDNIPLMFHCSAGKDRTGMGAALFLFALGVDEEIILSDYLSSNVYLGGKYAKYIADKPNLRPLFEVKPQFVMAGIDRIKKEYGTPQKYLEEVLGVDIQKMREMYLY